MKNEIKKLDDSMNLNQLLLDIDKYNNQEFYVQGFSFYNEKIRLSIKPQIVKLKIEKSSSPDTFYIELLKRNKSGGYCKTPLLTKSHIYVYTNGRIRISNSNYECLTLYSLDLKNKCIEDYNNSIISLCKYYEDKIKFLEDNLLIKQ